MGVPVIYFDLGNTLVHSVNGQVQPFADAVATITELWWRGYRIGLLSDQPAGKTVAQVRQDLTNYGLEQQRFDVITISTEFNPPITKPDPQIFQLALSKAGYTAASADTIFVTETLSHIQAARALGWRAIHKPYQASCTAQSGECVDALGDLLELFPQLAVDLYIRDAPGDGGADDTTGSVFWNSPDLWIRRAKDGGTEHQDPAANQDNWFYTRVHNRGVGIARVFQVHYSVREWAGTEFVYPGDYVPSITFTGAPGGQGGMNLDPGASKVLHAKWEASRVPPKGTHACWLAEVRATGVSDPATTGAHVWEHNNLAQKNLTIVEAPAGGYAEISATLGSRFVHEARFHTVELQRPEKYDNLPVTLRAQSERVLEKLVAAVGVVAEVAAQGEPARAGLTLRFLDRARVELDGGPEGRIEMELAKGSTLSLTPKPCEREPALLDRDEEGRKVVTFAPGRVSSVRVGFRPQQVVATVLRVRVPREAQVGERIDLNLVQRDARGRIVGGIAVQIHVVCREDERSPSRE